MNQTEQKEEKQQKRAVPQIFHRFEDLIAQGLMILISIMILAAFWGLIVEIYHLVQHGAINDHRHQVFQSVFGMIMTLLIAIEFNHTIMHAYLESSREVLVKTVILVAMLAIARQFIVAEMETISPMTLFALAFSLLSLGAVYWLLGLRPESRNARSSRRRRLYRP